MTERLIVVIALLVVAAALALAIRARARRAAERAQGQSIPAELLPPSALGGRSVLYFFGTHCSLCRQQAAVLDTLEAQAGTPVARIDAARHVQLARSLGVMTVPATAVLDRGQVQTVNLGPRSLQDLQAQLNA
jgi:hypothetical protein